MHYSLVDRIEHLCGELLCVSCLCVLQCNCAAAENGNDFVSLKEIDIRMVADGISAGEHHIKNFEQWRAFWNRFSGSEPPYVDFLAHDLLMVVMGAKPNGGYATRIVDIEQKDGLGVVYFVDCSPPLESTQITEEEAPYDTRLIPKLKAVTWKRQSGVTGTGKCR